MIVPQITRILVTALITLGLDRFERVQRERGAKQDSSQDDCDCKIASHLLGFLGSVPTKIPSMPYPHERLIDTEGFPNLAVKSRARFTCITVW